MCDLLPLQHKMLARPAACNKSLPREKVSEEVKHNIVAYKKYGNNASGGIFM